MVLNYKTRGKDVSPQGKPRVYFCCHPDDFSLFFDEISAEILALENCAIFYDESPQEKGDVVEWESRLADMQLFVMPVTSRLLLRDNKGLEEYRLAIKNHIPVLPLMQEKGLDSLFNQVCGNLQYLDKHQVDDTAISYRQKLKNFVESVLVGAVEAEEIRSAFRSYIFLSYRKKDRAHAQRLMKLIHKSDVCRDVAIWYDEYLVPGEDFNNAIGDALNKSHLFLLAVTPNLVCEPNYVQSVEYPMAVQSGKIILPVEMNSTDRALLNSQYDNIPTVIAESDEQSLLDALLKIFPKMDQQQNLRKDYLVALAYLDGVDVEVDHDRSLQMLTQSAQVNHLDSIRKLVDMYKRGKGVARNLQQAISWQKKIIQLTKISGFDNNDYAKKVYYYDLWALQELYYDLKAYDDCAQVLNKMINFAKDWSQSKTNEIASNLSLLNVYREMANLHSLQLQYPQAREYALQAIYVGEQLVQANASVEHYMLLSACFASVGRIYEQEEKFADALSYYEDRLTILETLSELEDYRSSLMHAYMDLFDLYFSSDTIVDTESKCKTYANKFLPLAIELADEFGDEQKEDLMGAYQRMGIFCTRFETFVEGEKWLVKALALAKEIADKTNEIDARQAVARMYATLSSNARGLGRYEQSKEYALSALQISLQLVNEVNVMEIQVACLQNYLLVGSVFKDQNDLQNAILYNQKALELAHKLLENSNAVKLRQKLADCYSQLAECYQYDDCELSRDYLLKAVQAVLDIQQGFGEELNQGDLGGFYSRLALSYEDEDNEKALFYHKKSLATSLKFVEKSQDIADLDACVTSYNRLAYFYVNYLEDFDGAIDFAKKACVIAEDVVEKNDDIAFVNSCELTYYVLGYSYYKKQCLEDATDWYLKMLELSMKVFDKTENVGSCKRIIIACNHLSEYYSDCEDFDSAKELQLVAEQYCRRYIEITGKIDHNVMLKEILVDIAQICFSLQQAEEGIYYYLQALEVARYCKEQGQGDIDDVADVLQSICTYYQIVEETDKCLECTQQLLDEHIAIAESDGGAEWYVAIAKDTYLIAECYYLLEDDQSAKEYFENAIQLFDGCMETFKDMSEQCDQDDENASQLADSIAQCQNYFAQTRHKYGVFLIAQNDNEQAVSNFNQATILMLEVVEYSGNLDDWEYLGEIFLDWATVEGGDSLGKAQQIAEILLENDADNEDYQDFAQRVQEETQNW